MINEIAQWVVLLVLLVFTVGLTRQLGRFLVTPREERAQQGPKVGERMPEALLPADAHDRLLALMREREASWTPMVFVRDHCSGCTQLLRNLADFELPEAAPIVAHTHAQGEKLAQIEEVCDLIIDDPDGVQVKAAGINAMPFIVLLDADLRVAHKQLGVRVDHVYANWRHATGLPVTQHNRGSEPQQTHAGHSH
jgi:hypothetical protein